MLSMTLDNTAITVCYHHLHISHALFFSLRTVHYNKYLLFINYRKHFKLDLMTMYECSARDVSLLVSCYCVTWQLQFFTLALCNTKKNNSRVFLMMKFPFLSTEQLLSGNACGNSTLHYVVISMVDRILCIVVFIKNMRDHEKDFFIS